MNFPPDATPIERAILYIYVVEERDYKKIAKMLGYKSSRPVYRKVRKFADFIAEETKPRTVATSIKVSV